MRHLVLLGDSIFDNATYVPAGEAVIDHVRARLPKDWKATLLAIDGNISIDLHRQLERLPGDATHLAISVGGNDALGASDILLRDASSAMQVLGELAEIRREFIANYGDVVSAVKRTGLPAIFCTIYDSIPGFSAEAMTALALFNDVIIRTVANTHSAILDLRLMLRDPADYAPISPIEPSARGGAKIAMGLISALLSDEFPRERAVIFR